MIFTEKEEIGKFYSAIILLHSSLKMIYNRQESKCLGIVSVELVKCISFHKTIQFIYPIILIFSSFKNHLHHFINFEKGLCYKRRLSVAAANKQGLLNRQYFFTDFNLVIFQNYSPGSYDKYLESLDQKLKKSSSLFEN